jgi:hypothetical protein
MLHRTRIKRLKKRRNGKRVDIRGGKQALIKKQRGIISGGTGRRRIAIGRIMDLAIPISASQGKSERLFIKPALM